MFEKKIARLSGNVHAERMEGSVFGKGHRHESHVDHCCHETVHGVVHSAEEASEEQYAAGRRLRKSY